MNSSFADSSKHTEYLQNKYLLTFALGVRPIVITHITKNARFNRRFILSLPFYLIPDLRAAPIPDNLATSTTVTSAKTPASRPKQQCRRVAAKRNKIITEL